MSEKATAKAKSRRINQTIKDGADLWNQQKQTADTGTAAKVQIGPFKRSAYVTEFSTFEEC